MKTDDRLSQIRYVLGPLLVYAVVSSLAAAALEILRLQVLQPVWMDRAQTPAVYAMQAVWPSLAVVIPGGAGLFSIRSEVGRERIRFSDRHRSGPYVPRDARVLFVLPPASVFLALGINSFFSVLAGTGLIADTAPSLQTRLPGLSGLLVQGIVFGLFMPLVEEQIFRGFLLSRLEGLYGSRTAVIGAALLFALYHGAAAQGMYAFVMGLVFGTAYCRTGRFPIPWGLHGLCNMAVLCLHWTGSWQAVSSPGWTAAFLAIAAAGFLTIQRILRLPG